MIKIENVNEVMERDTRFDYPVYNKFITLDITYDKVSIGEYTFIAKIEHYDTRNMVYNISDDIKVDEKYFTINGNCEHCNIKHNRKYTFLIKDEKGDIKQIGKSCLKEYIGYSVEGLVNIIEDIENVAELYANNSGGYETYKRVYSVRQIMNISKMLIDEFGYLSKSKAIEFDRLIDATSYKITEVLDYRSIKDDKYFTKSYLEILRNIFETTNDMEENYITFPECDIILEWIRSIEYSENEYINNLRTIASEEYIESKLFGYVASMFKSYEMHIEKIEKEEKKKREYIESQYVGNVGDKLKLSVELISHRDIETMYGTSILYLFRDDSGNMLTWFTTKWIDFPKDTKININATVKEHKEYNGQKQTAIIRVKML